MQQLHDISTQTSNTVHCLPRTRFSMHVPFSSDLQQAISSFLWLFLSMMRPTSYRKDRPIDEAQLQKVCAHLAANPNVKIAEAAREFNVDYYNLRNRHHGIHQVATQAHGYQQLVTPEQERVLCDWIQYLSDTRHPLSKHTIRTKVTRLTKGTEPHKSWIRRFLIQHPEIKLGKPSGLDPKRAQAFNRTTVANHFKLLKEFIEKEGISWKNVYNMDEKGCQRGGGRKASSRKYFVPRNRQPKYKMRSGNLELVTIIECICADGSSLKPGFVFSGKEYCREWFEADNDIW